MTKVPGRLSTAALAVLYALTNAVFLHAGETNLWADRRRAAMPQTAALPAAAASADPGLVLKGLPDLKTALSPSALERLKDHVPASFLARHGDLLRAIPPAHGVIRKIAAPRGAAAGPVVVFLQDVHKNDEAQENLARIVTSLADGGRASVVGLEAAFGPMDFSKLRAFRDPAAVRQAADHLLKTHQISGPVHAAYTFDGALPPFVGVDDEARYEANIGAYRRAAPSAPETRYRVALRSRALAREKAAAFNAPLLAFDRLVSAYHRRDLPFGDYAEALAARGARGAGLDLFLQALKMEKSLDFKRVESERARVVEALVRKLDKSGLERLMALSLSYRAGELSHADYYGALRAVCRAHGADLAAHPAMDAYVRYVTLAGKIDAEVLLSELAAAEAAVYARLARTPAERALAARSRRHALLAKLTDFSLTPDEWDEYQKGAAADEPLAGVDLAPFRAFYEEADARNHAMTEKLLAAAPKGDKAAVLVAGGFHTAGMSRLLTARGAAVVEVAPKLTKVDGAASAYLGVFTQERSPLEKLFSGDRLFVGDKPDKAGLTGLTPLLAALLAAVGAKPGDARADYAALGGRGELSLSAAAGGRVRGVLSTAQGRLKFALTLAGGAVALFTMSAAASPGLWTVSAAVEGLAQGAYFSAVLIGAAYLFTAGAALFAFHVLGRVLIAALHAAFNAFRAPRPRLPGGRFLSAVVLILTLARCVPAAPVVRNPAEADLLTPPAGIEAYSRDALAKGMNRIGTYASADAMEREYRAKSIMSRRMAALESAGLANPVWYALVVFASLSRGAELWEDSLAAFRYNPAVDYSRGHMLPLMLLHHFQEWHALGKTEEMTRLLESRVLKAGGSISLETFWTGIRWLSDQAEDIERRPMPAGLREVTQGQITALGDYLKADNETFRLIHNRLIVFQGVEVFGREVLPQWIDHELLVMELESFLRYYDPERFARGTAAAFRGVSISVELWTEAAARLQAKVHEILGLPPAPKPEAVPSVESVQAPPASPDAGLPAIAGAMPPVPPAAAPSRPRSGLRALAAAAALAVLTACGAHGSGVQYGPRRGWDPSAEVSTILAPDQRFSPTVESGFNVGGVNSNEAISRLGSLGGVPVPELNEILWNKVLASGQDIRDLLQRDNARALSLGFTHRDLALPLFIVINATRQAGMDQGRMAFTHRGVLYEVRKSVSFPATESYFNDGLTESHGYTVTNLQTGESVSFGEMDAHYIRRYGYYNVGMSRREKSNDATPDRIVEVFGLQPTRVSEDQPILPPADLEGGAQPRPAPASPEPLPAAPADDGTSSVRPGAPVIAAAMPAPGQKAGDVGDAKYVQEDAPRQESAKFFTGFRNDVLLLSAGAAIAFAVVADQAGFLPQGSLPLAAMSLEVFSVALIWTPFLAFARRLSLFVDGHAVQDASKVGYYRYEDQEGRGKWILRTAPKGSAEAEQVRAKLRRSGHEFHLPFRQAATSMSFFSMAAGVASSLLVLLLLMGNDFSEEAWQSLAFLAAYSIIESFGGLNEAGKLVETVQDRHIAANLPTPGAVAFAMPRAAPARPRSRLRALAAAGASLFASVGQAQPLAGAAAAGETGSALWSFATEVLDALGNPFVIGGLFALGAFFMVMAFLSKDGPETSDDVRKAPTRAGVEVAVAKSEPAVRRVGVWAALDRMLVLGLLVPLHHALGNLAYRLGNLNVAAAHWQRAAWLRSLYSDDDTPMGGGMGGGIGIASLAALALLTPLSGQAQPPAGAAVQAAAGISVLDVVGYSALALLAAGVVAVVLNWSKVVDWLAQKIGRPPARVAGPALAGLLAASAATFPADEAAAATATPRLREVTVQTALDAMSFRGDASQDLRHFMSALPEGAQGAPALMDRVNSRLVLKNKLFLKSLGETAKDLGLAVASKADADRLVARALSESAPAADMLPSAKDASVLVVVAQSLEHLQGLARQWGNRVSDGGSVLVVTNGAVSDQSVQAAFGGFGVKVETSRPSADGVSLVPAPNERDRRTLSKAALAAPVEAWLASQPGLKRGAAVLQVACPEKLELEEDLPAVNVFSDWNAIWWSYDIADVLNRAWKVSQKVLDGIGAGVIAEAVIRAMA